MCPLPPNEVGRITYHVNKGEEKKEGENGVGLRFLILVVFVSLI